MPRLPRNQKRGYLIFEGLGSSLWDRTYLTRWIFRQLNGGTRQIREKTAFFLGGKMVFVIFVLPNRRESISIAASIGGGFCFAIHCQPSYFLELTLFANDKAASDFVSGVITVLFIQQTISFR